MNGPIKIIKTCLSVLLIGLMGVLFCQTKTGSDFEEEFGLDWLFKLRGSMPPPEDIVIVTIDQASTEILHLPDDPEKWPRTFYAQLIEKINRQKPAILAFNIHFGEDREIASDQKLAKAMAGKQNVILSSYLKQKTIPSLSEGEIRYEQVIEPIPLFNQAALGTAPFPIPKTSSTVKEFWTYKHSAGDIPTFPVSIFQYFVIKEAYPEILLLLEQVDPELRATLPNKFGQLTRKFSTIQVFDDIQTAISNDVSSLNKMRQLIVESQYSSKIKQLLQSWLSLMKNDERLYLNHYGDVGTITTVPFYQALTTEILGPKLFRDKIVMIGYSDSLEPEKQQGFYTAYSKTSGKVISPIEIAATAVANLIDKSWLKPLPMRIQMVLVLVWGLLLSGIFRLFAFKPSVIASLTLIVAYSSFSTYVFASQNIWLPMAIPMLQAFVVILWQSATYMLRLRQVSDTHLPREVIDKIARKGGIDQCGILMHGVCMATDIDKYTSLSETIGSRQISKLINDYNAVIYPRIKSRKGLILNNIGDAILAGWVSVKIDSQLRRNACHAALEIKATIDRFNSTSQHQLLTRIGLHYGEMDMSFVGADGRYEYRAIGDTVNTSTRIEGLNKLLGTRILVSAPVIEGLQGFFSRELGTFLLKGKAQSVTVFELISAIDGISNIDPNWPQFAALFSQALDLFKCNQWQQALDAFRAIQINYPDDGPTRFYSNYLQNQLSFLLENKSNDHAVIIDVGNNTNVLL